MSLPELKQAQTLIQRAAYVLLIAPEGASLDAQAAMIAAFLTLQDTKEHGVDEVCASHVPAALQFLPGSSQVQMAPRQQAEIVLDVAGTTTAPKLRTEPLQGGVRLHLSLDPNVTLAKEQVELSIRSLPYDVAVIFGASDLEALGSIFTAHTDFFYNTPIINIDHRPDNEHYGTVNLVDITAGSVAEVTYDLAAALAPQITPQVATALYAGLISGTDSFQKPTTTPRSFQLAAKLMQLEADRESVIQYLVKTKPLSLLKLAGRLYARLRFVEPIQLFWSVVRAQDFQDSGARQDDLPRAIEELSNNIAGFNIAFVLNEKSTGQFEILLLLGKGLWRQRREIQEKLGATKQGQLLQIQLQAQSLEAAEQMALEKIKVITN